MLFNLQFAIKKNQNEGSVGRVLYNKVQHMIIVIKCKTPHAHERK